MSLPPAMRITFSVKLRSPAMVRLGDEAMESLYQRTPRRTRIRSMRCSTPWKLRATASMVSADTRPRTAAKAAI